MSCTVETITLTNSFFTNAGKYVVNNYTTTKDASGNSKTSCLPTAGTPPVSSFPATATDTVIRAHVSSWLATNAAIAPDPLTPTNNVPVSTFSTNSQKIRTAIKEEYCYYQNRYKFMLEQYLTNAASTTTSSTADSQKDCVIYLNSVLNQILQVYQALINSRNTTLARYYEAQPTNINSLNSQIDSSRTSLQDQAAILQNANLATDVQSAMVEYSLEKNQSSRNLLVIYGFMNLVAAGLLVYLYRSTRSQ